MINVALNVKDEDTNIGQIHPNLQERESPKSTKKDRTTASNIDAVQSIFMSSLLTWIISLIDFTFMLI